MTARVPLVLVGGKIKELPAADSLKPFSTPAGTGSGLTTSIGVLHRNVTPVGNVGSSDQPLMTHSIPANTFDQDGRGIRLTAWGFSYIANRSLYFQFGSIGIVETGFQMTDAASYWEITAKVFRVGADQQWLNLQALYGQSSTNPKTRNFFQFTTQVDTAAIVTGVHYVGGGSSNEMIQLGSLIEFFH